MANVAKTDPSYILWVNRVVAFFEIPKDILEVARTEYVRYKRFMPRWHYGTYDTRYDDPHDEDDDWERWW